jgi:hypothetical protein
MKINKSSLYNPHNPSCKSNQQEKKKQRRPEAATKKKGKKKREESVSASISGFSEVNLLLLYKLKEELLVLFLSRRRQTFVSGGVHWVFPNFAL